MKAKKEYTPTKEEMKKVGWCLSNGIKISPLAVKNDSKHYFIDVEINGKRHTSPKSYLIEETSEIIYNFYFDYYKKYKDAIEWWKELSYEEREEYKGRTLTAIKQHYEKRNK